MSGKKTTKQTEAELRNKLFVHMQESKGLHNAEVLASQVQAKAAAINTLLRKMEAEGVVVSYQASQQQRVYAFARGRF